MKDSLEYKILKYLKDNDNGDFIDMRNFIDDRKKLEGKLRLLAKKPGEYISAIFPIFIFGVSGYKDDTLQAKIEMNGIKLLNEIENQDLVFSINQETNRNNANKYKPWYIKLITNIWKLLSENKLISTLLVILILYLIKKYFGINLKT